MGVGYYSVQVWQNSDDTDVRRKAEQGVPASMWFLGREYYYGVGIVAKDQSQGLCWLREAAEKGNESARSSLRIIEAGMESGAFQK